MFETLRDVFLPRSFFTGSQLERRRSLLMYMLLLVGACSLPFYVIPHPDYNHVANLIGTAGYWGLLLLLLLGAQLLKILDQAVHANGRPILRLAVREGRDIDHPVTIGDAKPPLIESNQFHTDLP